MKAVIEDLESRLTEVEVFLTTVRALENASRSSTAGFAKTTTAPATLKACAFLLLYNVVESCVRASFSECYSEVLSNGTQFADTSDRFRDIWLRQQFDVPTDSANHQTYLNEAMRVALVISASRPLELNARKLPVSGNLSADKIRELCSKHGVKLTVNRWAKGGAELETIKEQRNALAHGHKSFAECGRDYTARDIERIFKQTRHFLNGFVKSIAEFNRKRGYRR